jgi:hypothetical protein
VICVDTWLARPRYDYEHAAILQLKTAAMRRQARPAHRRPQQ